MVSYDDNTFLFSHGGFKTRTAAQDDVTKTKQRKIDEILDKISKSGYESLTQEEKDFLFRAGKK